MRRVHSLRMSPGQLADAHTRSCTRAAMSLCSLRMAIDLSFAARHSPIVGSAASAVAGGPKRAAPAAANSIAERARFIGPLAKALGLEVLFALCVEVEVGIAIRLRFGRRRTNAGRRFFR